MRALKKAPTVLIVDDDQGLARLIEKTISREGFATATAYSGKEALAWLSAHDADLLLLDLKLQDIDGAELVLKLRKQQNHLPFIIITGQGDERVAVEMMKRGAIDYLVKDGQFLEFVPSVVRRAIAEINKDRRLSEAEEALRKEHAFSTGVLQASGALMMVLDTQGLVVHINQKCESTTGLCAEEVEGKPAWEVFLPEDDRQGGQERFLAALQQPGLKEFESQILTTGGDLRQIAWSLTLLRDTPGSSEYVIASGLDVTDRRHLEQEVLEISGREQQRIGQDLHDGLCQVLAGVEVLTEVLRKRLAQTSASDAQALSTISGYVKEAIKQARMVARGLSPVELDSRGLMSALHELANSTRELFKVDCVFECMVPVLVNDNAKATHLYRICQESISNAIRHGHAKCIWIDLVNEGDLTKLKIRDDGKGITDQAFESSGMGLRTMRYRASTIGATLDIRRAAPKGTQVVCSFITGL